MITNKKSAAFILIGFTLGCIILLFIVPPIAQDPNYHKFADERTLLNIPNFYNVISNLPFVVLGIVGLIFFLKRTRLSFSSLSIFTLFIGVTGIGLGSAYYHLNPSDATLVWDRIPMTITFMSFFAVVIRVYINERWGALLLFPLLVIGTGSVLTWYYGELAGHGDLRLYALVQFFPMIAIPLIIFLYTTSRILRTEILAVILLYALAKFFEHQDSIIFSLGEILSGHSIKHLFAAAAILIILQMVMRRKTTSN